MSNHIQTEHEKALAQAMKDRGIVFIEHHKDYYISKEGEKLHKTVDFFIPRANIIIEVDGMYHSTNPETIISDFHRDYGSYVKKNFTLRITNEAIDTHLDEIANAIKIVVDKALETIEDNIDLLK